MNLHAAQGERRAEMGDILLARPQDPVRVSVEVIGGAGYRLDVIADGKTVFQQSIDEDTGQNATEVIAEVSCERYVRAELVADASPDLVPAEAPDDLDLSEWRWAVTNPVYIERRGL